MINFKVIWQTKKSFTTPKELKGIKPFAKINFERDGIKSAYIDNNGDLWYKDNMVIIGNTKPIIEHDELYGDTIDVKYLTTKQFVKFENIHKYIINYIKRIYSIKYCICEFDLKIFKFF